MGWQMSTLWHYSDSRNHWGIRISKGGVSYLQAAQSAPATCNAHGTALVEYEPPSDLRLKGENTLSVCPDCFADESTAQIDDCKVLNAITDDWGNYQTVFENRSMPDYDRFEYDCKQ